MLNSCLNYYGIDELLSQPLGTLKKLAFCHHPSGYQNSSSSSISMSYKEIKQLLHIDDDFLVQETFRYAAIFGVITNVVISPFHVEWQYNSYHQRDLFFAKMRLDLREHTKISSL